MKDELPERLAIVVVGASGDLAARKIYPALFALYCQKLLPGDFRVYGFSRSAFTHDAFRTHIMQNLTCRYSPGESCAARMDEFLARCFYVAGAYDSPAAAQELARAIREQQGGPAPCTLVYMAIPSSLYVAVSRSLAAAGMVGGAPGGPWTRVVLEKPFGRDRASSDALTRSLAEVFTEEQTYRIDHYLGKEIVQNLMVLRFANVVFEPVWNRHYIERVWIDWREDIGLEGRAGYFDGFGILRDVIQNHLLQILALVAMERPGDAGADAVRDEKVRVLRRIPPVTLGGLVVGQYAAGVLRGTPRRGYREEPGVPAGSRAATFAAAVLSVPNERWRDVPFILRAGKAMNGRESEVRIQFRSVDGCLFGGNERCLPANELVIRIQPDEGIYLGIVSKEPGLDLVLEKTDLNLRYQVAFDKLIPDAYECLLLDVMQGDRSLFIRADELEAAWDIFTPALHELERRGVEPEPYAFGSTGPAIDKLLT